MVWEHNKQYKDFSGKASSFGLKVELFIAIGFIYRKQKYQANASHGVKFKVEDFTISVCA